MRAVNREEGLRRGERGRLIAVTVYFLLTGESGKKNQSAERKNDPPYKSINFQG